MSTPSLKQQKTFALVRIIGGFAAAAVLGYSFIANVLAGQPAEGPVLLTGVMALVGLGYAAFGGLTAAHVAAVNALAAGAILVSVPVMILFYIAQRQLLSGLTAGGVKG